MVRRVTREVVPTPEDLYFVYLAKLRQIRIAMRRDDCEALRRIELEFRSLSREEQHVAAMAVHDVAACRPFLAKAHFVRTLLAERRARVRCVEPPAPAAGEVAPNRRCG
jgi:hypothetical protein